MHDQNHLKTCNNEFNHIIKTIIIFLTSVHLSISLFAHLYHSHWNYHSAAHVTVHYAAALLLVVQPNDLFAAQPMFLKQNLILGLPT